MNRAVVGMVAAGLLIGGMAARADTALINVTPQSIQGGTFRLTSKAARNHTVEFVIRRDVRKVNEPGRSGYLSNSVVDGSGLGKPVKLEEHGKNLTFRFSVPEDQVANSVFTLWGDGLGGEGVTFEFHLGKFWKPNKD